MNILQQILQSKLLERSKRTLGKWTGLHIKLKRYTASASEPLRTAMLVKSKGIDLVIDIGANTGQFAESLYDFGYEGSVLSFEPVPSAHQAISKRSAAYPKWIVADRMAIGEDDGEIDFHITDDTQFSSVLPIEDSFAAHNTKSSIVQKERLAVHRLDNIIAQYFENWESANILLKIDTQGYEQQVLAGAQAVLAKSRGLKIEIPVYKIYQQAQLDFYGTLALVQQHGFQPYSFHIEGVDLPTGRVNTMDGLFFREK
jgi:FkbM family methyltransferase